MEAKENSYEFVQKEHLFKIPFFQRAYVWGEDEWELFFEDLKASYESKKDHFLGSVILKQLLIPNKTGEGGIGIVIDGQQRLTTFSILIKSLHDKLDLGDKEKYAKYLFEASGEHKIPKIKHSKVDEEAFKKVLGAENSSSMQVDKEDKIGQCYKYFSNKIEILDDHKIFLDYILTSKLWVVIDLHEEEDEQKIFDSINTAGLKLTATDIIKNAIFTKKDVEELYQKYWESVFESKKNRNFWQKEVSKGKLKRVQSEVLLHSFAILEGFFDYSKDTLENLSSVYKEKIKKLNKEELEIFLKKIKKSAMTYQEFPNFTKETQFSFKDREQRFFHILRVTDTNTIVPLILALKLNFRDRDEILSSCFDLLENFIITGWICRKSTKEYSKKFSSMAKKLDKDNPVEFLKKNLDFVSKENIEKCLTAKDKGGYLENKKATLILFWIELYRRYKNNKKQDIIELSYNFTLEHLVPQSWEENWKDIVKDEENAKELIHQIGNMTLLKKALNSSIKNASWKTKLEGYGNDKGGIEACADLCITRDLVKKKEWNEDSIKERTKQLIQDFFRIWDIEQFH